MGASVLVIGYGSDLRGDDAVGRRAAERIAAWQLPGVECLSLHQLTPELAECLASVRLAIFIDASVEGSQVEVRQLQAAGEPGSMGHTADPYGVLALAQALYGQCPQAWLVTIPVAEIKLGEDLSAAAKCGLHEALERVRKLLDTRQRVPISDGSKEHSGENTSANRR